MKHFCLHCGKELHENQYVCPSCHHNVYLDMFDDKMVTASSGVLSAINIELNTQWARYHCGKNGATGHGFAAEDYNNLYDKLHGFSVNSAGRNNAKNGADRIVDGQQIQTKYCATPRATINAAFKDNGRGNYRYYTDDSHSNAQVVEVPSDQYEECVSLMREKIENGQIDGVTDPNSAKDLVKKGSCSYRQARNIAKAGTINSLIFDIQTGAVVALTSLGVSFCVKLGVAVLSCRNMDDIKSAVQLCFLDGLRAGTITLSTSVFTMQVIRTEFGRNFVVLVQKASKESIDSLYGTTIGRNMTHEIASKMWDKTITGAAAKNVVIKLVRLNAVSGIATFVVTSLPDTFRCFISKSISKPQFIKNLIVNASSITGATIGGILGMKFGKPGALAGTMAGGFVGGVLTKKIADKISKDDSFHMQELIKIALVELSNEYLIQSEKEFQTVIRNIKRDGVIDSNLLKGMYQVGATDHNDIIRVQLAKLALEYNFDVIARQRYQFHMLENEQLIIDSINKIEAPED